jgi:dUTP pyrophosphatase
MIVKATQFNQGEHWVAPTRQYDNDAGFDLYVSRACIVHPRTFAYIPSNTAMAIPTGYWGLLLGRSSTFGKRHLICNPGVIDAGYRGEIQGLIRNPTSKKVMLMPGERVFQIIFIPLTHNQSKVQMKIVNKLPKGTRDIQGFGSTGGGI